MLFLFTLLLRRHVWRYPKNSKREEHKFMKTMERFKQLGQLDSVLAFKNNSNNILLLVSVEIS